MPTTRHVSTAQPRASRLTDAMQCPNNQHLLITTRSHIYAWDASGTRTVFTSGKAGIVAARARNGLLAVADSQIVVLHDTKHGEDQSWGLTADGDEVRLLENTKDGLYLTTKLTNEILRYSTLRSKVQSPIQAHNTAPVALGCSPTYVVSASDDPPVLYLKNLAHNTPPILLKPRASGTAVCIATFHPERDNVFLLGFRDGTIAAYNANEVRRSGHDGEIGHLIELHRGATGCAFVAGAKARAISVGTDARCRLVDLESRVIIRTWHAKAPLTSVCVSNDTIAVARIDGKVHLYNSVGVLQAQIAVSAERIISVEWVNGPPPPAIPDRPAQSLSDAPSVPPNTSPAKKTLTGDKVATDGLEAVAKSNRKSQQGIGLGLPPGLRRPTATPQTTRSDRKFTVHPDETEEGTVRHTPISQPASGPPQPSNLLELFSPVKPVGENNVFGTPEKRPTTSPRQRPRISTQTFVKSPVLGPADSHATSSGSETARQQETSASAKLARTRWTSAHVLPLKKRHISFQPVQQRRQDRKESSNAFGATQVAPSENAKVLASLRQMSAARPQGGSVLGAFAASKTNKPERTITAPPPPQTAHPAIETSQAPTKHVRDGLGKQKAWHPGNVLERESTWPTDSVQDQSMHENEDDIWLTDESDKEAKQLRLRRLAPLNRPPARQTSRSRVDSTGTHSTIHPPQPVVAAPLPRAFDGSTEDSAFNTAYTHLSPSGAFSPASADVRELFPRTSSLSPARKAAVRRPKSPWDRAKTSKGRAAVSKPSLRQRPGGLVRSPTTTYFECAKTDSRIANLEDEVARLKGEMLAMKVLLRRNGIPAPAGMARATGVRPRLS